MASKDAATGSDEFQVIPRGAPIHEPACRAKVSLIDEENKEPHKQKSSLRKKRKNENVLFDYNSNA